MVENSNYALGDDVKDSRLNSLLSWIDENAEAMLSDPSAGLEAIGVGRKNADDLKDDKCDWCIVGFVKRKIPEKKLTRNNVTAFASIASTASATSPALASPEMDVVETGGAFSPQPGLSVPAAQRGLHGGLPPCVDFQKRFDALRIGLGITNPVGSYPSSLGVGTIGFFVRDGSGNIHLVSNNHVIGDENSARVGNAVVQPGTLDLTSTELSVMNTLSKLRNRLQIAKVSSVVDIQFGGGQLNQVDVATAELGDERDQSLLSRIGFGSLIQGIAPPYSVDATGAVRGETRVYKTGRTTGWTEGRVSAIGVVSQVGYTSGTALFRNQIAIVPSSDNDGPFSDRGDSGSGIVDINNNLIGLLFAGSPARTLANPIGLVMSAIQNELNAGSLTLVT